MNRAQRRQAAKATKAKPVCSGSLPCKKFTIRSVKLCSSTSGGRFSSSGGGIGHCTTVGGAVGAVAQPINNSRSKPVQGVAVTASAIAVATSQKRSR